jgi:DNA processing protein
MAGLASLTVVVEGALGSGSLITAELAQSYGRDVGAVPGQVTSAVAEGPLGLLRDGAQLIRNAQDVLDLLYGPDVVKVGRRNPPRLTAEMARILATVERGDGPPEETLADQLSPGEVLEGLTELELLGLVRRELSGRYVRTVT